MRACRFSSVRSGSRPVEAARRAARRSRAIASSIGSSCSCDAEVARPAPRRRRCVPLGGVAARASITHGDALGARARRRRGSATSAESMPPERPSTTCSKPFLRDVVAQAEHERRVDLGLDGSSGSATGPPARRSSPAAAAVGTLASDGDRAPGSERAARTLAGVAQAGGATACSSRRRRPAGPRANCAARAIIGAGVVDDEGVAVEDELVLAADERAEGHRDAGCRARAGRTSARARRPCPRGRARPRC